MSAPELAYATLRVLSCGIWVAAGLFKLTHWRPTVAEMRHHGILFPDAVLAGIIALELAGSALLVADVYVWAVALAWIAFTIPASIIYHGRFVTPQGIDFVQYVLFWKNVSIVGGLMALVLLDPARPAWLLRA